jgi:hypothetical protein
VPRILEVEARPSHLLQVTGEGWYRKMLEAGLAKDAGVIGCKVARHVQLVMERTLRGLDRKPQRQERDIGRLRRIARPRRQDKPRAGNPLKPAGKPPEGKEELGIGIRVIDRVPVPLQLFKRRHRLYDFDTHGFTPISNYPGCDISGFLSVPSGLTAHRSRNARSMLS